MDERAHRRLEQDEIAWLTTVDIDGQPQASPVWFVWDGEALHIASEPEARKVANVAANPRAAVHLEGAGPADLVVSTEGRASATGGVPTDLYIAKYELAIGRLGLDVSEYLARFSVGLRIDPTRWRIFGSD